LGILVVWSAVLAAFRYVSLASLVAAVALPTAVFLMGRPPIHTFAVIVAAAIGIRHHENIRRLLSGTESAIGRRAG
jgi:glycerol-3-phosphate acyltransferase PlsY